MYYLASRYYDHEVGRFISVDGQMAGVGGEINGYNLYSYCQNNPVNMSDLDGNWPKWATKVLVGVAVIAAAAIVTVATGGVAAGTLAAAVHCVAAGALKGAIIGGVVGATDGFMSGSIGGAISGGMTSNVCFVAGTSVLTAAGYVAIEDIFPGDKVWSENPETGDKEIKEVVRTFVNETNELVHVHVNEEKIITTPEHPFHVPKKGWIGAIDLRAGDILVLQSGEYVVVELIQHEILESPITVYNFEVEDFHTYYVGINGILVHNTCCQRGVGGKGWVGDKTWRGNVKTIDGGGTITSLDGGIPTVGEATSLIKEAAGTVLRVEGGHLPPNPHTFSHINYLTKNGVKGTIQILEP